jgi:hypothetical protein
LGGRATEASLFFSEELLNRLGKDKRISLVERRDLKKVLEELELHISGVVDSRSAKEVGSFLGAEVLCTGTVMDLSNGYKINVRVIDTETGKIFAVAEVLVDKGEEIGILKSEISNTDHIGKGSTQKYQQGNFLVNGGFQQRYSGWKRSIGDITQGSSQTEIISLSHAKSGKALHIKHRGEGYIQFHQGVIVPGPDLLFSASFQASSREGAIIGFSGTGIVQIGLQYFGETGEKLGETILVNYVKNPFADTPLIGVPRRKDDTYKIHYIEFPMGKFHSEYQIDIRKEIENNLLGMDAERVRSIAVVLWCGASHSQASAELWISDISLGSK